MGVVVTRVLREHSFCKCGRCSETRIFISSACACQEICNVLSDWQQPCKTPSFLTCIHVSSTTGNAELYVIACVIILNSF